jgi:transposase
MKILTADEIKNLNLAESHAALITYASLTQQMAGRLGILENGYQSLIARMEQDKQQMLFAKQVIQGLNRERFGVSSEQRPGTSCEIQEVKPEPAAPKKRERSGPTPQPRLPVQVVQHELPEGEQICDACGKQLRPWKGQFEESERIQVIPARFVLEKHQRQKYGCSCGCCIKTAPGPQRLKEGGRYSPEFAVEVGISKYEHHVPLERQVKIMKQQGLEIESQTLFSQIDTIAWYLKPVYGEIGRRVREAPFADADETPWENLGTSAGRSFYLWGARSSDAVFFQIADSRSSKVASDLLQGFCGILMCDGFSGYKPLESESLTLAHCWSHVRRKFIASENAYPKESKEMVSLIGELYGCERSLKDRNATSSEILSTRQQHSRVIVDRIYAKLWELKQHLPQSSLGKAVDYTLKLWRGLTVFIDYPQVSLDNNAMEREIRGPVTGRKNHLGSKNLKTAEVAAVWYSVISSCRSNKIDPKIYIQTTLTEILTGKKPKPPWEYTVDSVLSEPSPILAAAATTQ